MFRIGQKVVCVNDDGLWDCDVKKGLVFTVSSVVPSVYGAPYLCCHLREITRVEPIPFNVSRFRPLVEKKTDISVFTEILRRETIDDGPVVAKPRTRVTSDSGLSHD